MNKFENVDVLAALEQLMRQNTAFYRNDFEILMLFSKSIRRVISFVAFRFGPLSTASPLIRRVMASSM